MNAAEREILYQYFVSQRTRLEDEFEFCQARLRYRRTDSVDCLEYMIAKERLNAFIEFSDDVQHLLKIVRKDDEK